MRICLCVHGFPPFERTGVENYTRSLAAALVRAGHQVEVFTPRPAGELPDLALRREEVDGYGVNWMAAGRSPAGPEEMLDPPGVAHRFGDFLDRERPDVVHFQHVVKLGIGLVAEARRRGIPAVYTAHDYYALCHRYTLLRPDLERCETVGNPELCTRCDLALSVLNEVEELGDYQMGALEEQLSQEQRARLSAVLEGHAEEAGFSEERVREAVASRTALDRRRLEAFRELDLVLAPTHFLRERLIEGGLDPERVRHLPYGIETAALEEIAREHPVGASGEDDPAPLRIGYFGGFSKHKGVHVLLDAFARLRPPAELELHGIGTDRPYVELLRERASEVGARWCGAYEPEDLPAALAEVDVVVVPSLWVENYPIVIREAFAAGRPVVASRLGALSESVRDGVDGLLFEPGDAAGLAEQLERCATEDELLAELARGIEPVRGIDRQAEELVELYETLCARKEPSAVRPLPTSLVRHVERYAELSQLPSRDLFQRAMTGLGVLGGELLGRSSGEPMELLLAALAHRSNVQDELRDRRRETEWVRETLGAEERELEALTRKIEWMEGLVDSRDGTVESLRQERGWLEESIQAKKVELEALASERDELATARAELDREREWLQDVLEDKSTAIEALRAKESWLSEVLVGKEAHIAELESAREELLRARESLEEKCAWLEGVARDKELAESETRRALEQSQQALERESAQLEERARRLEEQDRELEQQGAALAERDASIELHERRVEELRAWLDASRDVLEAFEDDEAPVGEGVAGTPSAPGVLRFWETLLTDVERLLDSEELMVAPEALGRRVEALLNRLDAEDRELHWRRGEMAWLSEKSRRGAGSLFLALGRLRSRVRSWSGDSEAGGAE